MRHKAGEIEVIWIESITMYGVLWYGRTNSRVNKYQNMVEVPKKGFHHFRDECRGLKSKEHWGNSTRCCGSIAAKWPPIVVLPCRYMSLAWLKEERLQITAVLKCWQVTYLCTFLSNDAYVMPQWIWNGWWYGGNLVTVFEKCHLVDESLLFPSPCSYVTLSYSPLRMK